MANLILAMPRLYCMRRPTYSSPTFVTIGSSVSRSCRMLATMLDHFGDRFNFAIAANGDIDRDRTIAAQGVAECQGLVTNGPFARGEIGNHHDKRKPKERLCLASYRFPPRINFL